MWRFKTKKEFEKEFGDNWQHKIKEAWNSEGDMDHLLGWCPKYDQPIIEKIMKTGLSQHHTMYKSSHKADEKMRWTYSKDMFIKDNPQLEFEF